MDLTYFAPPAAVIIATDVDDACVRVGHRDGSWDHRGKKR
jgi:hypothetical protein